MRTKSPKFIFKRGSIWYARFTVNGKTISISTGCTDQREAMQRAKAVREAYRNERWDVLRKIRPKHGLPTIGEIIAAYERANQRLKFVRPRTASDCVSALRLLLREVHGEKVDELRADVLTDDTLMRFEEGRLADAKTLTPTLKNQAKRTAWSTINKARAIFGRVPQQKAYRGVLTLPDLTAFLRYKADHPHKDPVFADDALWAKTIQEARKLREENPALWVTWILCYEAALRKSEAISAQRDWLIDRTVAGRTIHYLRVQDTDGFETKGAGSTREVPLSDADYRDLVAMGGEDYLIPAGTHTGRNKVVMRQLSPWMRKIGWSRAIFTQCAHQLRREKGRRVFEEQGPAAAQAFMGHRDISTTIRHYARFKKPLVPLPSAVTDPD